MRSMRTYHMESAKARQKVYLAILIGYLIILCIGVFLGLRAPAEHLLQPVPNSQDQNR